MTDQHVALPADQVAEPERAEQESAVVERQEGKARLQIILTFVGGMLLLNAVLAHWIFPGILIPETGQTINFYADVLGVLAALLLGGPLVLQALRDLWNDEARMTILAALAVVAAFAIEAYLSAGAIAFLMQISMLIEQRTALGARKSIESLVRLTPTRAHRLTPTGEEQEVSAAQLQPGDVVVVRPGDNIPGDGVILKGESTIDQANITGESIPVDRYAGEEVFGGTINMTGVMQVRITKAGRDTTLGRVKDLILQAEKTRIPVMRLIDRYARWYTPVILMLAFLVWFVTREAERSIAMLVIACAPALILATPTAMVAALSAAARLGVLVKNVSDLETARNLTSIVFDKTGTLTTGKLMVTRLAPLAGVEGAELLRIAASVEQNSRHPVARAVVDVARRARLNLMEPGAFEEVSGRGVRAAIEGKEVLVGRDTWLQERGIDLSNVDTTGSEGLSLLYVARDGRVLGWVGLEDKTRADASRAMDELRELGIRKLVMVTGDRWSVAKRVAAEMHCTDVQAEVLPAQKLDLVDDLRRRGHKVAVVGDGVNDAPALAAGDISIAMGAAGSDVAIHSASIALMNNNLNRIPFLVRLSRQAFAVVRQNLGFALLYIVLFESLAALGYIEPVMAAILHLGSSLIVVFNSARLVREGEEIDQGEPVVATQRPAMQPVPVS